MVWAPAQPAGSTLLWHQESGVVVGPPKQTRVLGRILGTSTARPPTITTSVVVLLGRVQTVDLARTYAPIGPPKTTITAVRIVASEYAQYGVQASVPGGSTVVIIPPTGEMSPGDTSRKPAYRRAFYS